MSVAANGSINSEALCMISFHAEGYGVGMWGMGF